MPNVRGRRRLLTGMARCDRRVNCMFVNVNMLVITFFVCGKVGGGWGEGQRSGGGTISDVVGSIRHFLLFVPGPGFLLCDYGDFVVV